MDDVIRDVKNGLNVMVNSRAGCGKTTLLLRIAAATDRKCVILTYNRALCDEARVRLKDVPNCTCHTIHAMFGLQSGTVCSTDIGLLYTGEVTRFEADIVMIDEAQDLRPSLVSAILRMAPVAQYVVCGDNCQVLYSYIIGDSASSSYLDRSESVFAQLCINSEWSQHTLCGSHRLTPSVAELASAIFKTPLHSLSTSQDIPVRICVVPLFCPAVSNLIANLIDVHGAEGVMVLGRSVMGAGNPIRCHVNRLCKKGYLFNIKEYSRGFDNSDWKNRTRVWTFCGSKGCEADVVVIFGAEQCDLTMDIGVAVSRARKHLIMIHASHVHVHDGLEHVKGIQYTGWDGTSWTECKPSFGAFSPHDSPPRRRMVKDRTNMSAALIKDLLDNVTITETHSQTAEFCTDAPGHSGGSEDMIGLYSKALEYLIQVRCGHSCPDAFVCTLSGRSFETKEGVTQWLTANNICIEDPFLDNLHFPLSCSSLRYMLNSGAIPLCGPTPYFASDRTLQLKRLHAELQRKKTTTLAVRMANQYLAMDNYCDRLCMSDYSWVHELDAHVTMVKDMVGDLSNGVFGYRLTYKRLSGTAFWAGSNKVVEILFLRDCTYEHRLQLSMIASMYAIQCNSCTIGVLFNAFSGTSWTIQMSVADATLLLDRFDLI